MVFIWQNTLGVLQTKDNPNISVNLLIFFSFWQFAPSGIYTVLQTVDTSPNFLDPGIAGS